MAWLSGGFGNLSSWAPAVSGGFVNPASGAFDGTASYAYTNSGAFNFEYTQAFSVSVWMNPLDSGDSQTFLGNFQGTLGNVIYKGWRLFSNAVPASPGSFGVGFQLANNINNYIARTCHPDPSVHIGRWVHVCGTYDGSGTLAGTKVYLNGQLQATGSTTDTLSGMSIQTSNPFAIGQLLNSTSPYFAKGNYNQVTIWTTELTSVQVSELYRDGQPGQPAAISAASSLLSWYPLKGNTDTSSTIYDHKGTNDLTNSNITFEALVPPNANTFSQAHSGSFNGSSAYLDLGNAFDNDGTATQSFSFWFKPSTVSAITTRIISKLGTGGGWAINQVNDAIRFQCIDDSGKPTKRCGPGRAKHIGLDEHCCHI
jgi:hypothetical protein